jgi:hypothetical protein
MTRFRGWRAAALSVFAVAATACSDSGPTQPEPQYTIEETVSEAPVDMSSVAVYRSGSPPHRAAVMAWIGPEGGTLRLLDMEIVVPAGAVAIRTKFRIKLPADPKQLNRALAEFEPHGVTFLQPVTLRMPYRSTTADGTTPSVIWWNGASWIRYETTLLPDGRVETQTDHFSFFATELLGRIIGITPVGG